MVTLSERGSLLQQDEHRRMGAIDAMVQMVAAAFAHTIRSFTSLLKGMT